MNAENPASQPALKRSLRASLRLLVKPLLGPPVPYAVQRAWLRLVTTTNLSARGVTLRQVPGTPPLEILAPEAAAAAHFILYLHGGAYCVGSPATQRSITSHLAVRAAACVHVPDYRLAPEHPYPAAVEDALAAYRALLAQAPAARIALAGDSAGGGLALATALAIRDAGLPQPAALALISPWVDLTLSGESLKARAALDPLLRESWLAACACHYGGVTRALVGCSPLSGDLRGLPPLLIQVGSDEILYSDSERLAAGARAAGVEVTLHCFDGLWHDFQAHAGVLRDADAALEEIAQFFRRAWNAA